MLRLAACSYEGSLFGWSINLFGGESDEKAQEISLDYAFHASPQSLKAIAISASGKYLASAGANERISVYNLNENRELGELGGHAGGITNLQFFEDSVLISASEDSNLLIWRVHDWENIHTLGGHKATIDAFAIHPSGKLAMSTDRDNQLKIWNLVQGRCSYTRKVLPRVDYIAWHPLGKSYALCSMNMLKLFAADSNSESFSYTSRSRINHVTFFQSSSSSLEEEEGVYFLAFICDNQTMTVMDLKSTIISTIHFQTLHGAGRLKSICSTWVPDQGISLISIVTSSGCLLLLDGSAIISQGTTTTGDLTSTAAYEQWQTEHPVPKSTTTATLPAIEDNIVERALIGWHQLSCEPRLTALSAVYILDATSTAVTVPAVTSSKKGKAQKSTAAAINDIELHVDEDAGEEQDPEDDNEDEANAQKKSKDSKKKKTKKNKRKKPEQDITAPSGSLKASNNENQKAKKVKFQQK